MGCEAGGDQPFRALRKANGLILAQHIGESGFLVGQVGLLRGRVPVATGSGSARSKERPTSIAAGRIGQRIIDIGIELTGFIEASHAGIGQKERGQLSKPDLAIIGLLLTGQQTTFFAHADCSSR